MLRWKKINAAQNYDFFLRTLKPLPKNVFQQLGHKQLSKIRRSRWQSLACDQRHLKSYFKRKTSDVRTWKEMNWDEVQKKIKMWCIEFYDEKLEMMLYRVESMDCNCQMYPSLNLIKVKDARVRMLWETGKLNQHYHWMVTPHTLWKTIWR